MTTLAQITNPVLPKTLGAAPTIGTTVVGNFIAANIGLLFLVAFILAAFFLVLGGIQWIMSTGDKAKLEAARDKIIHALMGLLITGAIWAVLVLVGQFFGFSFTGTVFKLPLPTINQGVTPSKP